LYPTVYAAVFRIFGVYTTASFIAIQLLQAVLAGGCAVLLLYLGRELFSQRVGLLAGVMYALWLPGAVFDVWIIWGTTLLAALALGLMLLLIRQVKQATLWRSVAMGLLMGAMLMTEPSVGVFLIAAMIWLGLRGGRWGLLVPVCVGIGLMVGPWVIRNRVVMGAWVPIKSNLGHELFIGNHPQADGFYGRASIAAKKCFSGPDYDELAETDELTMSAALGRYAWDSIAENPIRFTKLTAKRTWWFWRFKFDAQWETLIESQTVWKTLRFVDEAVQNLLLILAYLGVVFGLWRRAGVGILGIFLLTYPLSYYVTHVDIPRYRYPVWPVVFLLAAWFLMEGWRFWRRGRGFSTISGPGCMVKEVT